MIDGWKVELESFLSELCVSQGFCSLGDRENDILAVERYTAEEFALAVLQAEGFKTPQHEARLFSGLQRAFIERYGRPVIAAEQFRKPS